MVPNGVDTELFHPGAVRRRAARELLFVGRLTAQKNVLAAVEAMADLPPDVHPADRRRRRAAGGARAPGRARWA